jgi:hypothetical protein
MGATITLDLKTKGGQQGYQAIMMLASGAAQVRKATETATKEAENYAKALTRVKEGAASTWSPQISEAHKAAEATRQAADAAKVTEAAMKHMAQEAAQEQKKTNAEIKKYGVALKDAGSPAQHLKTALAGTAKAGWDLARSLKDGGGDVALGRMVMQAQRLDGALQRVSDSKDKFSNLSDASRTATQVGAGLSVFGGAGLALIGKSTMDAGELNRMKAGISGTLGSNEQGAAFVEQVRQFDLRNAGLDFRGAMGTAQNALAQGFKPEELLNSQGTGLMDKVGNAVVLAGGGPEQFNAVFKQLAQIRSKGKASQQDINAITEGGRINVRDMLKNFVSPERFQEIISGGGQATSQEVFGAMDKSLSDPKYAKGAAEMLKQLPVQIDNLKSSLFQLSADFGQFYIPIAQEAATFTNGLVIAFKNLPGPLKGLVAYGGLAFFGVVTLVGGLLTLVGISGQAFIGVMALNAAMEEEGIVAGLTAGAFTGKMIPALLTTGAVIAAAAVVIWAYMVGAANAAKAAKMSEAEWQNAGGVMLSISRGILNIFDWIGDKIDWLRGKLHLGGTHGIDEGTKRGLYEAEMEKRRKHPEYGSIQTYDEWYAEWKKGEGKVQSGDHVTPEPSMPSMAGVNATNSATTGIPDLSQIQAQFNGTTPATSTLNESGAALPSMSGVPSGGASGGTATAGGDVRALQYALQFGGLNKKQKLELRKQIFNATTAKQNQREAEKSALHDQVMSGVNALGDGMADAQNIDRLQNELAAARLSGNKAQVKILSERIRRATEARSDLHEQSAAEKRAQSAAQRERDFQHRIEMQQLRNSLKAQGFKGAEITQRVQQAENQYQAQKYGYGLPSGYGGTRTGSYTNGLESYLQGGNKFSALKRDKEGNLILPSYKGYSGAPVGSGGALGGGTGASLPDINLSGEGTPRVSNVQVVRGEAIIHFDPLCVALNEPGRAPLTARDIKAFAPSH